MLEAIRTLLNTEPRALKAINEVFHINYNNPYKAVMIEGKTTIKQIIKAIEPDDSTLILVLNYHNKNHFWNDRYQLAVIDNHERVEVDYTPHYFYADKLNTYHAKGDFRNDLKDAATTPYHIIIAQDKQYLNKVERKSIDYTQRFRTFAAHKWNKYIINLTDFSGNSTEYHAEYDFDDINKAVDKSGYIIELSRKELKRRANALRAERKQAAFKATDNTAKVEELRIRIKARQLELIEQLKAANTSTMISDIGKALDSWTNGLSRIMQDFEEMQTKVSEKSYASIEDFERHYNRISEMLINNRA